MGEFHYNKVDVATQAVDTTLYALTAGRKGYVRAIIITNSAGTADLVKLWDVVTTSAGTAMVRFYVASKESIALGKNELGELPVLNGLVCQSTVATGAAGKHVFVYASVEECL